MFITSLHHSYFNSNLLNLTKLWQSCCFVNGEISICVLLIAVDIYWFIMNSRIGNTSTATHTSCVPIQGQHPSPPAKAFGAFPGCVTRCSRPYPYINISAAQVRKSDKKRKVWYVWATGIPDFLFLASSMWRKRRSSWFIFGWEDCREEVNLLLNPQLCYHYHHY